MLCPFAISVVVITRYYLDNGLQKYIFFNNYKTLKKMKGEKEILPRTISTLTTSDLQSEKRMKKATEKRK
jgi:hypothetical protein